MSERALEAALWPPYLTMCALTAPFVMWVERVPKRRHERNAR